MKITNSTPQNSPARGQRNPMLTASPNSTTKPGPSTKKTLSVTTS